MLAESEGMQRNEKPLYGDAHRGPTKHVRPQRRHNAGADDELPASGPNSERAEDEPAPPRYPERPKPLRPKGH